MPADAIRSARARWALDSWESADTSRKPVSHTGRDSGCADDDAPVRLRAAVPPELCRSRPGPTTRRRSRALSTLQLALAEARRADSARSRGPCISSSGSTAAVVGTQELGCDRLRGDARGRDRLVARPAPPGARDRHGDARGRPDVRLRPPRRDARALRRVRRQRRRRCACRRSSATARTAPRSSPAAAWPPRTSGCCSDRRHVPPPRLGRSRSSGVAAVPADARRQPRLTPRANVSHCAGSPLW